MASYNWYEDGVITVTNGSADVTGVGTLWQMRAYPGDMLSVTYGGPASVLYQILSIETDTKLTLSAPYAGTSETGVQYAIMRNFTGGWSPAATQAQQIQDLIKRITVALNENLKGDKGDPGTNGNTILGGPGVPAPGAGVDGDWYLDWVTMDMYRKEAGTWTVRGNFKGAKGDKGLDGLMWYFDQTPSTAFGNVGDVNLNMVTGDVTKRTVTGWAIIGNLKGPEGKKGDGIKGDPGDKGPDGSRWYTGAIDPTGAIGVNLDMYLNTSSGDTFRKSSDVWTKQGNIKGPTGHGVPGEPGINFKGEWTDSLQYNVRDSVRYLKNLWIATIANNNVTPPSSESTPSNSAWSLLVPKGLDGLGSGDMLTDTYDPTKSGVVLSAKHAESADNATNSANADVAKTMPWSGLNGVPAAQLDQPGIVQLATPADTVDGLIENKAVTPVGLKLAMAGLSTNAVTSPDNSVKSVVALTRAQYDALLLSDTVDPNTQYNIIDDIGGGGTGRKLVEFLVNTDTTKDSNLTAFATDRVGVLCPNVTTFGKRVKKRIKASRSLIDAFVRVEYAYKDEIIFLDVADQSRHWVQHDNAMYGISIDNVPRSDNVLDVIFNAQGAYPNRPPYGSDGLPWSTDHEHGHRWRVRVEYLV